MMHNPNLAIIIPCFNKVFYTRKTVESLLAGTGSDLALIIVDDCSTDETNRYAAELSERLNKEKQRFYYHKNERNIGVNASWNAGLRIAMALKPRYICVANNDLAFAANWDLPLATALDTDHWLVSPYSTERALPPDFPAGMNRHVNPLPGMPILGACFMFRPKLIETIGYVPEQMVHYYGDNWLADICRLRNLKAGHVYESYVHHYLCQTTQELDNKYWFQADRQSYERYCREFM